MYIGLGLGLGLGLSLGYDGRNNNKSSVGRCHWILATYKRWNVLRGLVDLVKSKSRYHFSMVREWSAIRKPCRRQLAS